MIANAPEPPPPAHSRPLIWRMLRNPWTFQIVIATVLLAVAIWQIDVGEVAATFRHANYAWVAFGVVVYVMSRIVHTWEWQMTLTKVGRAPFGGLFGALLIGTLVNAVIPAAAGDVAKVQIVANRYGLSRSGLIAGRGAESLVNAAIMVLFIGVSFTLPGAGFGSKRLLVLLAIGTCLAFAAISVLSHVLPREFPAWRIFNPLPRRAYNAVEHLWPRMHDGFELVRQPRLLALAVVLNVFGWLVDIGILWSYGQAFGLDVPFSAYIAVTVAVAIITTFPITFGNVGTYELALLRVLALYGVADDRALAYAVGTHVFSTVFNIGLGMIAMLAMRISPNELFSLHSKPQPAPAVTQSQ